MGGGGGELVNLGDYHQVNMVKMLQLPKYVKSTRRVNTALFYTSSIKLGLQSIQTSVWPHYSGLDLNAASPLAEWSKSDPLTVNTVTMKRQFCLK